MTDNQINKDAVQIEINKLVKIYSEMEGLKLDIQGIRESLKLEGVDVAEACKYAQAKVKGDVADKHAKVIEKADFWDLMEGEEF